MTIGTVAALPKAAARHFLEMLMTTDTFPEWITRAATASTLEEVLGDLAQ
ncbi:hypothetical protein [Nocardia asiatica]